MKKVILAITSSFILFNLFAQGLPSNFGKPPIDSSVFDKWPSVIGGEHVSNDGNFTSFNYSSGGAMVLVLQAIKGNWKMELPYHGNALFTDDSQKALFINKNDSLCLQTLGSRLTEYIPGVASFKLFKHAGIEWLVYRLKNMARGLVYRNLAIEAERSFPNVTNYILSENSNSLLLQVETQEHKVLTQLLRFPDGDPENIWEGSNASGFVFDALGNQLVFLVDSVFVQGKQKERSVWYYKVGYGKPKMLADDETAGIDTDLKIDGISSGFSKDNSRLFISLKEKDLPKPILGTAMLDVWSYTDAKLQSQQLKESGARNYDAVINIDDNKVIRLQQENERILSPHSKTDNVAVVMFRKGEHSEGNWNTTSQLTYYKISTRDGTRKLMEIKGPKGPFFAQLSPAGKYMVGIDGSHGNIFCYDLSTGVTNNLTQYLPIPLTDKEIDEPQYKGKSRGLSFASWFEDDKSFLAYDSYDIWQIDPAGEKAPVNITNGYGRKHEIEFRLAGYYADQGFIPNTQKLILSVFDKTNKNAGFFSIKLNKKGDPELLTMGPYSYGLPLLAGQKARDAEVYIITRGSATQSNNYFWTSDFKTFTPLTHVYPEKNYNWLSTELVTWKTFDGTLSQGILYKPENFDPKKKYPIIFYYYEKKSDKLNEYQIPEDSPGWMNIPWFVSNGYLVFTPDIYYTIGETGRSVYNSVVSAAKYLSKKPWVNAAKMGIQGHSFGGYETNYLVTHTNIFAAAMSASGKSDFVSEYGGVASYNGVSLQFFYENDQCRIGETIWQRPDLFIKNSPVFFADKVTTPLLMMNNKEDGIIPFAQGVEFFTALRRLGKKAWMLQYDGEGHGLSDKKNRTDYTIRMTQFFDHYLKGAPAPKWMLFGIPAKMKGIDDCLRLVREKDKNGNWVTPGLGLLTEEERKKIDALKKRKPILIKMK
ncbi:MAG: prolyl oligopeptidase family serine peptidase [Bacteroidota bacterium]